MMATTSVRRGEYIRLVTPFGSFGPTFQGEGPSAGQLALFIRLSRCDLSCPGCDTPESWDWSRYDPHRDSRWASVQDILWWIEDQRRTDGVPQGRSRAEWLTCYRELLATPGVDMIGLSKLSVPHCFDAPVAEARIGCVARLLDGDAPKPFHLLGGDRSLPWELWEHRRLGHDRARHGGLRSNDSSFAFWYAACGIGVDADTNRAEREATTKPDLAAGLLTENSLAAALSHAALLRRAAGLA